MNNSNKENIATNDILQSILNEITPLDSEKTNNKMLVASKIYDLIESYEGNKSEFAAALKKRPSEISKWISGSQNFTLDTLTEIAWFFGKKINYLLEEERPPVRIVFVKEIHVQSRNSDAIMGFGTWRNKLGLMNPATTIGSVICTPGLSFHYSSSRQF